MKKNIVHEIGNYLHQIISNAEHISSSEEHSEYGEKIKVAAYKIDALITDTTSDKSNVNVTKKSSQTINFENFVGLNVLIVDDVVENIRIMENIFNTLSCNITSALSGEEALDVFDSGFEADIICMDMMMPGIDGATATKELKLRGCNAYFIAISALKNQTHETVSLFDCWLPKPFTMEHINGALLGYEMRTSKKEEIVEPFVLEASIDKSTQEQISHLAKKGAYSELKRLIQTLDESESKKFLNDSLRNIDFQAIIKSILSS